MAWINKTLILTDLRYVDDGKRGPNNNVIIINIIIIIIPNHDDDDDDG